MPTFKIWEMGERETTAVDVEGKTAKEAAYGHGLVLLDDGGPDYVDLNVRVGRNVLTFRVRVKTEYEIDER